MTLCLQYHDIAADKLISWLNEVDIGIEICYLCRPLTAKTRARMRSRPLTVALTLRIASRMNCATCGTCQWIRWVSVSVSGTKMYWIQCLWHVQCQVHHSSLARYKSKHKGNKAFPPDQIFFMGVYWTKFLNKITTKVLESWSTLTVNSTRKIIKERQSLIPSDLLNLRV